MARPTVFKKGPMTAAERQRRRRKNLARAAKAAERSAKQAENQRKYGARQGGEPVEWVSVLQRPLESRAEELVLNSPIYCISSR
jgi:hypothetical protein